MGGTHTSVIYVARDSSLLHHLSKAKQKKMVLIRSIGQTPSHSPPAQSPSWFTESCTRPHVGQSAGIGDWTRETGQGERHMRVYEHQNHSTTETMVRSV